MEIDPDNEYLKMKFLVTGGTRWDTFDELEYIKTLPEIQKKKPKEYSIKNVTSNNNSSNPVGSN